MRLIFPILAIVIFAEEGKIEQVFGVTITHVSSKRDGLVC